MRVTLKRVERGGWKANEERSNKIVDNRFEAGLRKIGVKMSKVAKIRQRKSCRE